MNENSNRFSPELMKFAAKGKAALTHSNLSLYTEIGLMTYLGRGSLQITFTVESQTNTARDRKILSTN